ncbi:hypothetical protein [Amycolatopsis keratiniphila]|uniref:hypothetical protein n=1 Tax=Amycolatopsis keratiniphila TaxID=129921 RepID=UPI000B047222|nr:hypothetical protein [Amycolatopsis keratiniphila]
MSDDITVAKNELTVARLAELAAACDVPDGGFTVDPITGVTPRAGFAVSVHPQYEHVTDAPATAADLAAYLTRHAPILTVAGRAFGGWHNPDNGRVYLDVSIVVPTLAEALDHGRAARQLSVYDLAIGACIDVPAEPVTATPGKETPAEPKPPIPAPRAERTPPPCPPGNHARSATSRPPKQTPAGRKPTPNNKPASTPKRSIGGRPSSPTYRRSPMTRSPHSR